MLEPNKTITVPPESCACGCCEFDNLEPYYTHQHIELSEIIMLITHFVLLKGRCRACGKTGKGHIPKEFRTGYGPQALRSACRNCRQQPRDRQDVLLDRASKVIEPHYETIKEKARSMENHMDSLFTFLVEVGVAPTNNFA
jgi:transposase